MEADLILGCVTASLVFFAPLIAFSLAGSVTRYAPYGYLFTLVTSLLWVVYGLDWGLVPLLGVNAGGAGLAAVYVGLFLWRSDAADRRRTYLLRLVAGGAALLVAAFCIHQFVSKDMYGCVCSVVSCVASVAPFYKIGMVRRDKNMEAMPPFIIPAIGLINALIWTGRNTLRPHNFDLNLVVASGVAAFFALVQVVLHAWFFRRQPPPPRTGVRESLLQAEDRDGQGLPRLPGNNGSATDGENASDKGSVEGEKADSDKSAKHTDDDADQTESTEDENADQTESTGDDNVDQTQSSEDDAESTEDAANDDNKVNARDSGADGDLRLDVRSSSSDGEHHDETEQALQAKQLEHIIGVRAAATTEVHDVDTA